MTAERTPHSSSNSVREYNWINVFLQPLTRFVIHHPLVVILLALIIAGVGVWGTVNKLEFKTSRLDLINPNSEFNKRWLKYIESFGSEDDVVVIVEGRDAASIQQAADGVGEALIPLGGMYEGEANRPALRTLANHSALVATIEGLVCGAVFFAFAPTLAVWYGFDPASFKLYDSAVFAIRTLALVMPFMGLLMMMNTHYLVVRHIPFAVSVTVMKDFVFPCAGVLILGRTGSHWGEWMWVGFAAGYVVAAAYPFLFVLLRYGRGKFPWLIERDDGQSVNFAFRENENGRKVLKECFISFEEGDVRIVVRDNGPARKSALGRYLNTLGCNRTEYRFDIISADRG